MLGSKYNTRPGSKKAAWGHEKVVGATESIPRELEVTAVRLVLEGSWEA